MAWPPMVTVPELLTESALNGWNFPPSAFSVSLSDFLSGGFGAPGAANKYAGKANAAATPKQARNLNRLILFSTGIFWLVCPAPKFSGTVGQKSRVSLNGVMMGRFRR